MHIGFTGTREGMTEEQQEEFSLLLNRTKIIESFHHGDCIGADSEAHDIVRKIAGVSCPIYVHPAVFSYLRAYRKGTHVYIPLPPIERNHRIVDSVDYLIAAPKEREEVLRSGTWATIRYAYRRNKKITIILPDGALRRYPL